MNTQDPYSQRSNTLIQQRIPRPNSTLILQFPHQQLQILFLQFRFTRYRRYLVSPGPFGPSSTRLSTRTAQVGRRQRDARPLTIYKCSRYARERLCSRTRKPIRRYVFLVIIYFFRFHVAPEQFYQETDISSLFLSHVQTLQNF